MTALKKAFFSLSALFPLPVVYRLSGIRVLLPYHHVVSNEHLPHIRNLYAYKNEKTFEQDLDWLLQHFKPVSAAQLAASAREQSTLPQQSFLLSFDDGFREIHDIVAPMLLKKGVPAIFFINPAFIDNKELFYRSKISLVIEKLNNDSSLKKEFCNHFFGEEKNAVDLRTLLLALDYRQKETADEWGLKAGIDFDNFLQTVQPFMTTSHLHKLSGDGFTIGAHSWDHPHYRMLSLDEQLKQTDRSLDFVRTFNELEVFAFPHQDHQVSQEFFDHQKQKEKKPLFFGLQNQKSEDDNFILHRYNAEDPGQDFSSLTKGILLYNSLLRRAGKQTVKRQLH